MNTRKARTEIIELMNFATPGQAEILDSMAIQLLEMDDESDNDEQDENMENWKIKKGEIGHIGDSHNSGTDVFFCDRHGGWVFVNYDDLSLTKKVDRFVVVTTINKEDPFLDDDMNDCLALDTEGRGLMALECSDNEAVFSDIEDQYLILFDSAELD